MELDPWTFPMLNVILEWQTPNLVSVRIHRELGTRITQRTVEPRPPAAAATWRISSYQVGKPELFHIWKISTYGRCWFCASGNVMWDSQLARPVTSHLFRTVEGPHNIMKYTSCYTQFCDTMTNSSSHIAPPENSNSYVSNGSSSMFLKFSRSQFDGRL